MFTNLAANYALVNDMPHLVTLVVGSVLGGDLQKKNN